MTITQEEMYLEELPDPISREECFLAAAAGMDVGQLPEPVTRREQYLARIAAWGKAASGGGGEAAGTAAVAVSRHNTSSDAHEDLRKEIQQLSEKIPEAVNGAMAQAKAGGEFDGADGHTPVKGVDYYTEEEKAEWETVIAEEIAKRGQMKPEYANSIEECTDTTKLYVLPDGFIYAYMLTWSAGSSAYTNVLPLSVNKDGTDYVGDNGEDGYRKGYRYSASSGAEKAAANYDCIGYIPVKAGDVIRIKNIGEITQATDGSSYATMYQFDSGFTQILGAIYLDNHENQIVAENGVYTIPVFDDSSVKWCKLTLMGVTDDTIITINEEITESSGTATGYAWASTGHAFVPADYEGRIIAAEKTCAQHTAKIAELERKVETGGFDASEAAAYDRIRNWKYPVHEDAPVFLLEADKAAISSGEQTTEAVYAKYDALMAANPGFITRVNCGMASDGTTPVYVYHFREAEPHYSTAVWSETKPVFLVCSGVHPTEQSGVHSLYHAMEEIATNPKLGDLHRNVHFIVMPMINPTGFSDSTYGVRNPDGIQVHYNFEVDFKYPTDSGYVANGNRNHGGETPLSIPETQYFDALMEEYKEDLAIVISCHNNDVDEQYGTGFIWCSCASHFMCNLGFRFVDKMSAAWRGKYGTVVDEGIRWANEYALAQAEAGSTIFNPAYIKHQQEWDYRVGRASLSGSGGTEYKQALKYGVHGINVEVCDRCMILDKNFSKKRTANVVTMGCETYINFFRTFLAVYDPKNRKDYAPNLPWRDETAL